MIISPKTKIGIKMFEDKRYRTAFYAVLGLVFNLMYAFYNGILGLISDSSWFEVAFIYYLLLCIMRFVALINERKRDADKEIFALKITGALLIVMSFVMMVIIYIGISQNVVAKYGEITMLTIATYTFTKITLAIIKAVKHKNEQSPALRSIRAVSYAEVAVSLFSMQRSMLVSFGDMPKKDADILNIMTGKAVCTFVLVIGIIMIKRREISDGKIKNSKSK